LGGARGLRLRWSSPSPSTTRFRPTGARPWAHRSARAEGTSSIGTALRVSVEAGRCDHGPPNRPGSSTRSATCHRPLHKAIAERHRASCFERAARRGRGRSGVRITPGALFLSETLPLGRLSGRAAVAARSWSQLPSDRGALIPSARLCHRLPAHMAVFLGSGLSIRAVQRRRRRTALP